MENNSGYQITETNQNFLSNLSGIPVKILRANIGWYVIYSTSYMPRWLVLPENAFRYDDVTILESAT